MIKHSEKTILKLEKQLAGESLHSHGNGKTDVDLKELYFIIVELNILKSLLR
jgi:hypothetical protein